MPTTPIDPGPLPHNEAARLALLAECRILDTPVDSDFDDLTHLAAQICGTPVAFISLIDGARQWFKSSVGLDVTETPRRIAFCPRGILEPDEILVIPDATKDPRFADNELVTGEMGVRFYAGAPLVVEKGLALGSLCVVDSQPRELAAAQLDALGTLARQVVSRIQLRRQNFALQQTEEKLRAMSGLQRAILDSAAHAVIATTPEGIITEFNPAAERMLGYSAEEMVGRMTPGVFHDAAEVVARAKDFGAELGLAIEPGFEVFVVKARHGLPNEHEWTYLRKDGSRFPVNLSVTALRDVADGITGFLGIAIDITERKRGEALLVSSLEEKETLLKEVHHRVKNNLQVISSLLQLQSDGLAEPRLHMLFREAQDRVRAMALVHESLYRSGNLAAVNFGTHVQELAATLLRSYTTGAAPVRLEADTQPVHLDIDVAVPLSLIVNELVTNAFKHSFGNGRGGVLRVVFRECENGGLHLSIGDDGPGLPAGFRVEDSTSLGLKVVRILAAQLAGCLHVERDHGTVFALTFPRTRKN